MASSDEVSVVSEWEYDEETGILDTEGEEACLKTNREAWNSCKKLQVDANFHKRYISIKDALRFRDLSSGERETFVEDKGLAYEDQMFLSSEKAVQCLEKISDAVVCIRVKQLITSPAYGTGFLVQFNNEVAVITNSHSIRSSSSGKGIDFSTVKPDNIRVTSFYNEMSNTQVNHDVDRVEKVSPPDKDKKKNVLLHTMEEALRGDGTKDSPYIRKCNKALEILRPYFNRMDAFLDYVFLYLKPLQDEEQEAKFANVKPLEMKAFQILETFRNVSCINVPNPLSWKSPLALRLYSISHPHRKSQQVSFGGLESNLFHVYELNRTYGQNDTEILEGENPFAEHSIATCPGSSGAPIFFYTHNHETGEVIVDEAVYFLHFCGEVVGKLRGKAVSLSTIINHLERQALHEKLASAFVQVREHKDKSTESA